MKTYTIGRNGDQPFTISASGVSGEHARLTVDDDGTIVIEDLGSKNGTYVLDPDSGIFNRIESKTVGRNTIVRLGPDDTIRSYTFPVAHIFKSDPDDYSEEFQHIRQRWRSITARREKLERRSTVMAFIPVALSVVLLTATFFLPDSMSVESRINLMRGVMVVPALLAPVFSLSGRKRLRRLNSEIKETMVCPNPECNQPLTETDIRKGRCRYCKKHI